MKAATRALMWGLPALALGACSDVADNLEVPETTSSSVASWLDQTYRPDAPGIEQNPLKGFLPFTGGAANSQFPHSMEWFYLPLKAIQTGQNEFAWSALDARLNEIAARGKQSVFRVHLDYPTTPSGIPTFLLNGGLQVKSYTDYNNSTSLAPDWNDESLMTALVNFIHALGARYDGDPRIGFITAGLYGFWGEWHNYPHSGSDNGFDWTMSQANKDRLISAYDEAFNTTHVQLRDPTGATAGSLRSSVGYHDDSFAFTTLGPDDWHFWPSMKAAGLTDNWKTHPTGGELRPELQNAIWEHWPNTTGQDYQTSVRTTHASWMINHGAFSIPAGTTSWANALRGHKLLGYELFVSSVLLPGTTTAAPLTVQVKIQNRGVAPFYYDWPVEIGVLGGANELIKVFTLAQGNLRLTQIPPDSTDYVFTVSVPNHALGAGSYKLAMRVKNPLPNGRELKFANQKQDADRPGWLSLGDFSVTAGGATGGSQIYGTQATDDSTNVYYRFSYTGTSTWLRAYVDTDQNPATGFAVGGIGADYLVENGWLYRSAGSGWNWSFLQTVQHASDGAVARWTVPRAIIGKTATGGKEDIVYELEAAGGSKVASPRFVHTYGATAP